MLCYIRWSSRRPGWPSSLSQLLLHVLLEVLLALSCAGCSLCKASRSCSTPHTQVSYLVGLLPCDIRGLLRLGRCGTFDGVSSGVSHQTSVTYRTLPWLLGSLVRLSRSRMQVLYQFACRSATALAPRNPGGRGHVPCPRLLVRSTRLEVYSVKTWVDQGNPTTHSGSLSLPASLVLLFRSPPPATYRPSS